MLLLGVALLLGCLSMRQARADSPLGSPAGWAVAAKGSTVADYSGAWEYRYGDSPRDGAGRLLWALPGGGSEGFRPTTELSTPPGGNGARFMWLRTRIVAPTGPGTGDVAAPGGTRGIAPPLALFAYNIDDSYEAYLDGVLIARFGELDPPSSHFRGTPRVFLQLGGDSVGRLLALRIHSPYGWIGLFGTPRIGPPTDLLQDTLDRGLPSALIGFLAAFLGVLALVLFAIRRRDWAYLYYGCFALSAGVNLIARSMLRDLLLSPGPVWTYAELLSAVGVVTALSGYVGQVFGPGPWRIVSRSGQMLLIATAIGSLLVALGVVHVWQTVRAVQLGCLVLVVVVGGVAFFELRTTRGESKSDGRILAVGVCVACAIELIEILMLIGVLPRYRLVISHYAVASIVLCLGLILVLRFSRVHRRMDSYANVLQLSLATAREREPGQHLQVALAEVLRVLGGSRALIFEREPQAGPVRRRAKVAPVQRPVELLGSPLQLVAGRDAIGRAIHENHHDHLDYDALLIAEVLRRRRPSIVGRERDRESESTDHSPRRERLSIAAAPLLARGDAFGVLYLESDAGRQVYRAEDLEILLGLCSQVALTLMTTRAVRLELESELARQRLAQQSDLLGAAARMAAGDLGSPIVVPKGSELEPLGSALETMRQDLQQKFEKLAQSNKEIQQLNEELRRQIENRSQRLMEALLRGTSARKGGQVAPGKLLGEHYQVLRTLGKGAMGAVFEVERVRDTRHFAAKVLSEQGDRMALLRFAREGQILSRLDHPNLVSIVDIDITEGGTLFLVMELVRGTTLKLCLDRFRDPQRAIPVLRQIAEGLSAIHARGIVHRDLKPANVLIADGEGAGDAVAEQAMPRVKLVDFGVSTLLSAVDDTTEHGPLSRGAPPDSRPPSRPPSPSSSPGSQGKSVSGMEFETTHDHPRLTGDELASGATATMSAPAAAAADRVPSGTSATGDAGDDAVGDAAAVGDDGHLTQTGILVGTPMYMAPELSEGSRDARPSSDVFSLGVIAYELLTGEVPFSRPPVWTRWRGEVRAAPSLVRKRPDLPAALCQLVDSCLHDDPANRPTATAVVALLDRVMSDLGAAATPSHPVDQP